MSRVIGAIVVVIAAALGADKVLGSLSRTAGDNQIASDLGQLTKVDPTKPTEVVKEFDPQSNFGKQIKPIMLKMAQRDESFQKHLPKHDIDDVLSPANLVDPAKRDKSLARIDDRLKCFQKYMDDMSQMRRQMLDSLNGTGMPGGDQAVAEANKRDAQAMKFQIQLMDHYRSMIKFVGKVKASVGDDQLLFEKDADVERYNAMLAKCQAFEDTLNRVIVKAEKDRAEKLQGISDRIKRRY